MQESDLKEFEKFFIEVWELVGAKAGEIGRTRKHKLNSEFTFKYELQRLAWEQALWEERKRNSVLIEALEEIANSKYEANPWTIVPSKEAKKAIAALNEYKENSDD